MLSASSVTIASPSWDSPSAARSPELIAVPRPRLTLSAHDRDREPVAVLLDDLAGAVGGAVVDEDHARAELAHARGEIGEQVGDVLALVVGGSHEADHDDLLYAAIGTGRVAGMSSSVTGRELAAESRTASAAASARQPS